MLLRGAMEDRFARSALALRRVVQLPQFGAQAQEVLARPARSKVAVPSFLAEGVPAETARTLTRVFAEELMHRGNWEVSTPQEIAALLSYNQHEALLGCASGTCAVDVGKAMGADRLVIGSIGKIGEQFVVSASLLELPEGAVEKRVSHNGPQAKLIELVRASADELEGP